MSAILAADVAGYSRLMHSHEEATHAKLTTLLADPRAIETLKRVIESEPDHGASFTLMSMAPADNG